MKTQEILIDSKHEYTLITDENAVKLYYSTAEHWSEPNTEVMSLENNGDGYKISPLRKKNHIDYQEAEMLYILLSAVKESKIEVVEIKREI